MTSPTTPSTNVIIYRYEKKLVYVPVAPDYAQALRNVRIAFPELNKLPDAGLSLSANAPCDHKLARISALVWPNFITHLSHARIIDVEVEQQYKIAIMCADADGVAEDEKLAQYMRSNKRGWFFRKRRVQ